MLNKNKIIVATFARRQRLYYPKGEDRI
jgi:hypothetical protein